MALNDLRLDRQTVAFQADRQGNVYVAFQDFSRSDAANPDRKSFDTCMTRGAVMTRCVRGVAPAAPVPVLQVNKLTRAGAVTQATVPWTFTPLATPGSRTVEWIAPRLSGFEALTPQFGGMRLLSIGGYEVIGQYGDVQTPETHKVIFSDPLRFDHTPSFNPDDYYVSPI